MTKLLQMGEIQHLNPISSAMFTHGVIPHYFLINTMCELVLSEHMGSCMALMKKSYLGLTTQVDKLLYWDCPTRCDRQALHKTPGGPLRRAWMADKCTS